MPLPTDTTKYLEDEYAALNGWHRGLTPPMEPVEFTNEGPRIVARCWADQGQPSLATEAIDAMVAGLTPAQQERVVTTIEQLHDDCRSHQRCREGYEAVVTRCRVRQAEAILLDAVRDYPSRATASELAEAAADVVAASGPVVHWRAGDFTKVLDDSLQSLEETHRRGWLGLRLPSFKGLDTKLCGLRGLMLLAAGPGVGKTQLTLQLGVDVLSDPSVGLVYLTLEMSKTELAYRLLSMASGLGYRRLRMGDQALLVNGMKLSQEERRQLEQGDAQLRRLGNRIAMYGPEDIGPLEIRGRDHGRWYEPLKLMVEEAKRRRGVSRALVVVDNLQAIAVEPPHGRPWASDLDRDRVVVEGLTRLQHDLNDPVLVVSEVAKGRFKDADDTAAVLGTGRNTYRADAVMLLKRRDDAEDRISLIIDKGRDGMVRGKVELEWHGDYSRLAEVES